MGRVIVGTAGHIDHGKSSLVRALTGTDPDRLPEEKRRQITIDLGYAFLEDVAAIIDVPGHEKFIHNMVAGAATVDFALLVIAADDGVMPQTREHLHILRLLGIPSGAIVLTKCGVTESSWRELVKEQIREVTLGTFLVDAPIFEVDSLSGAGIPSLREYLVKTLPTAARRSDRGVLRIPIDRVFTIHGHGTVVTGTLLSGTVEKEQRVEFQPGAGPARVKQLQSNAREHTVLRAGMRAALNVNCDEIPVRGQTLTQPHALRASRRLAIRFEQIAEAPPLKDRQRVRVLIGTQEVMARFRLLGSPDEFLYGLLLLDEPVVAIWNDRCIIRRYSPMDTLGGALVLESDPPLRPARQRAQAADILSRFAVTDLASVLTVWLEYRAPYGLTLRALGQNFGVSDDWLTTHFLKGDNAVSFHAGFAFHASSLRRWCDTILKQIAELHARQKDATGFTSAQLAASLRALPEPLLSHALAELQRQKRIIVQDGLVRLQTASNTLDENTAKLLEAILQQLQTDGFAPSNSGMLSERLGRSKSDIERALVIAMRTDRAMRLGTDMFFEKSVFANAVQLVRDLLLRQGTVQVSELSKVLTSSRKYVVPFLEYLDMIGITERRGNDRVPGRNFENSQ